MHKSINYLMAALLVTATVGLADEVIFKSGDRLTGTVKSVSDGKMVFDSKVAGSITLDLDDIATFSTDEPIAVELADGKLVEQKAAAAAEGQISLQADAGAAAQVVPLADIAKVNPEPVVWKGNIVAGATFVRGNTKSDTASVTAEASRRSEIDRISFGAGYFTAKQRDNTTRESSTIADNWFARGQYDYFMTDKSYLYGNLRYEKDRIAHLDRRISPGAGFGYQWIETDSRNFSTEAGLSWMSEKYTDPNETRTYMAGRLAYHLDQSFNDYVMAFHNVEYIPSFEYVDNFLVNADIGLRAKLTTNLALEAKAQMNYNSTPAEERDKKDMRYIVGLGWTF